ncbi:hypothetical protein H1S01_00440 [Heliobacterium chlorum]|uniref:Uncharacterized protein n=1 Tax=Heliobacterium chlorum TaxID=2698 RepID=A0ABR7SWN7_HELCL|nr:hypothetical protein [Heliobacterium chlorum]MBC9782973.1 hypothetical protein [Heliobacterium chlorum]
MRITKDRYKMYLFGLALLIAFVFMVGVPIWGGEVATLSRADQAVTVAPSSHWLFGHGSELPADLFTIAPDLRFYEHDLLNFISILVLCLFLKQSTIHRIILWYIRKSLLRPKILQADTKSKVTTWRYLNVRKVVTSNGYGFSCCQSCPARAC